MIKACVIGASGYTGAELARLIAQHPDMTLSALYVSKNSQDANKSLADLHPYLHGQIEFPLIPLSDEVLPTLANTMDAIFLATPHEASHDWMQVLAYGNAKVFDLSGAFRIKDADIFEQFYGFAHQQPELLQHAQYGLAEWYPEQIKAAKIIAVPGCYPTASLIALKPLCENQLIDSTMFPIINAVSGVSGAGRKASMTNSFCEVSLQAYGVLGHRHQPEISSYLGTQVIFTPHLGNFKRGILATISVKVSDKVSAEDINQAYQSAYANKPAVRLLSHFPKLQDAINTPFCDLHWKLDQETGYAVIGSAIDNLLKGASSQAIQCANLAFSNKPYAGLIAGAN